MGRQLWSAVAALVALGVPLAGHDALAGGNLEAVDFTGAPVVTADGRRVVEVIEQRWDERCIPIAFRLNGTQDPINNPNGPASLSLDDAETALQASLDSWNEVATSFIDMNIVGRVNNPGFAGLDSVNEVTFNFNPAFGDATGVSISTILLVDAFLGNGLDLDRDGDGDVSNRIATCEDVDRDGDIELPAGNYQAGTILENDVWLNASSTGVTFSVDPPDGDPLTTDLEAVATHEFGHSHGLSHSLTNQIGANDGTAATMWPFGNPADAAFELGARSLHTDDTAYSSLFYPEPAATVPAAAGAVRFDEAFGIVTGEVWHGVLEQPVAGATVFAVDVDTGRRVASAFSGAVRCLAAPQPLFASPSPDCDAVFTDPADGIVDGTYVLPLPAGRYRIGIEAIDGAPTAPRHNTTVSLGVFYGQQNFPEEFFDAREAAVELNPATAAVVEVVTGEVTGGIDLVTNQTRRLASFQAPTGADATPGLIAAVRIPAALLFQELAVQPGRAPMTRMLIHGATFLTRLGRPSPNTNSAVPVYARAMITTGTVDPATGRATLDLDSPLAEAAPFVGQDFDFTPLFVPDPLLLGARVQAGLAAGTIGDLFLVLETPAPGSGSGPAIPFGTTEPVSGLAFVSTTGGNPLIPVTADLPFTLDISAFPEPGPAGGGVAMMSGAAAQRPR